MTSSIANCVSLGNAKDASNDNTAAATVPTASHGYGFKYALTRRRTSDVERLRAEKVDSVKRAGCDIHGQIYR